MAKISELPIASTLDGTELIPIVQGGVTKKVSKSSITEVSFTSLEKTKLTGIASGATVNATDTQLRDRTTHSGVQAISTVTGLQTALDSIATGDTATLTTIRAGVATAGDTLAKLYALIQTLNAIVTDATNDGDSIVDTVQELLTIFATYPEGVNVVTTLAGKIDTSAIVNALTQTTAGSVLDARQGKALNDLIVALTTTVGGKQDTITAGTTAQYYRGDKTFQTLNADVVPDGTTNKAYTATEKTKLSGIATGATANSADATLLARTNHTGTQAFSTISGTIADAQLPAVGTAGTYGSATQVPVFVTDGKGRVTSVTLTTITGGGAYTLPVATSSVLGGIKQGTGVTIAGDGTLSATAPDLYIDNDTINGDSTSTTPLKVNTTSATILSAIRTAISVTGTGGSYNNSTGVITFTAGSGTSPFQATNNSTGIWYSSIGGGTSENVAIGRGIGGDVNYKLSVNGKMRLGTEGSVDGDLDVVGSINVRPGGNGQGKISLTNPIATGICALDLINSGTGGKTWTIIATGNNVAGQSGGSPYESALQIQLNGSEKVMLTQNGNVGIGGGAHTSAYFDINGNARGSAPFPSLTASQRAAITTPKTGLFVFQTDGVTGLWKYNGTAWRSVEGAKGTSTFNGTGALTTFTIAHGLGYTPTYINVQAGSNDADGTLIKFISADGTNITVTYKTAPITGTNNVVLYYQAS